MKAVLVWNDCHHAKNEEQYRCGILPIVQSEATEGEIVVRRLQSRSGESSTDSRRHYSSLLRVSKYGCRDRVDVSSFEEDMKAAIKWTSPAARR